MRNNRSLFACLAFGLAVAASSSALADGCFSVPKCWQYHNNVSYGYYTTKWRRWEESSLPPASVIAGNAQARSGSGPVKQITAAPIPAVAAAVPEKATVK
jgi:hypothetical protein